MKLMLIFILTSLCIFAQIIPQKWQSAKHSSVKLGQEQIEYPFVHIENKGATPVLLLHGIGGNAHNWMELGSNLSKAGYDVWAFSWLQHPKRNIDQSWQTVQEIVDYVYAKTNKKMFLAGHSLGGIVSKIYLFGVRNLYDQFIISKEAKLHGEKHIRGFVSIASPNGVKVDATNLIVPGFEFLPENRPIITRDLSQIIREGRLALDLLFVRSYEFNSLITRVPVYRQLMKLGFNMDYHPYEDYNLGKFMRYGAGGVPKPVTDQVAAVKGNLTTADGSLNYTEVFFKERINVPMAFIAGEVDVLALGEFVEAEASEHKASVIVLPQAGHIDPIIGDMEKESLLFMINFFLGH